MDIIVIDIKYGHDLSGDNNINIIDVKNNIKYNEINKF
jgi:hypothetical protein